MEINQKCVIFRNIFIIIEKNLTRSDRWLLTEQYYSEGLSFTPNTHPEWLSTTDNSNSKEFSMSVSAQTPTNIYKPTQRHFHVHTFQK